MTTPIPVAERDELKSRFLDDLAKAAVALLPEYVMDLRTDGEVEDKRKFIALAAERLGWTTPAPKDPNANLPMANIVINLTPLTAANPGLPETIEITPTPSMLQYIDVNADVVSDD